MLSPLFSSLSLTFPSFFSWSLDDTTVHSSSSGSIDKNSHSAHSAAATAAAAAAAAASAKRDPLCLHNAAYESNIDLLKHLIEEGADINYRDKNNWTPLHCCSSTGQLGMCELLLAQKVRGKRKRRRGEGKREKRETSRNREKRDEIEERI
jgi:ankyrin repeat protein